MVITKFHITPCGMNRHLCMAYFKKQGKITDRNNIPCPGCRGKDPQKTRSSTPGDTVTLIASGSTKWFVIGSYGTWADIN